VIIKLIYVRNISHLALKLTKYILSLINPVGKKKDIVELLNPE